MVRLLGEKPLTTQLSQQGILPKIRVLRGPSVGLLSVTKMPLDEILGTIHLCVLMVRLLGEKPLTTQLSQQDPTLLTAVHNGRICKILSRNCVTFFSF